MTSFSYILTPLKYDPINLKLDDFSDDFKCYTIACTLPIQQEQPKKSSKQTYFFYSPPCSQCVNNYTLCPPLRERGRE